MKIKCAHLRERAVNGGWINFMVFDACSSSRSHYDNNSLLHQLTSSARQNGLRVDQSALAFKSNGRIQFYGTSNLVDYLSKNFHGITWTHTLDI